MKTASLFARLSLGNIALGLYLLIFFGYLLGPLVVMSITAFNSSGFPQIAPWECLTFEWFDVLSKDDRILNGLKNSLLVAIGTVSLSVMLGLAGALMLTQIWPKMRSTYYTIIIAPILIPGVVLGISTLVFWDRINILLGFGNDSLLHNGLFLTILGQSTFIASYCMLVFVARLQRFDTGLTEAALDLGATNVQAFRRILLPFMKPAIASAAVLAFLASFENYNTTTFTFGKFPTLTIELAQKVRYGINPSISALAFIIVVLTIFFALPNEIRKRRQQLAVANGAPVAAVGGGGLRLPGFLRQNPAAIIMAILALVGFSTIWFSQVYSPNICKAEVKTEKHARQVKMIAEVRRKMQLKKQQQVLKGPDIFGARNSRVPQNTNPGRGSFGSVFEPGNLDKAGPEGKATPKATNPGKGTFGNVFDPGNLDKVK